LLDVCVFAFCVRSFLIPEQGHHHDPAAGQLPPEQRGSKLFTDQELVSLIDPILSMDDINRDGFIDYPEFVQAQHKAAATQQTHA
jgi:hypothetical protein